MSTPWTALCSNSGWTPQRRGERRENAEKTFVWFSLRFLRALCVSAVNPPGGPRIDHGKSAPHGRSGFAGPEGKGGVHRFRRPRGAAGLSGGPAGIGVRAGHAVDGRPPVERADHAHRVDCGGVAGVCLRRAGARGVSAADALEPAGRAARGRFFGARTLAAAGRRAGRSDARGQYAGQHAARAAAGRHGSHHAAAHGDARDRRRHLRLRRAPAPAPGESRRRAAAGCAAGESAGPDSRTS